ncbi:MAG: glycosyltransferase family 4 protein [Caldilineaceae bacterium]|nr:glycosyltransferase family 4 protein [Caldilineaceae bacterium]
MLIGIDASRALRTRRTGTERYSLELIRHILALPEAAGHQWRLYVETPPPSDSFEIDGAATNLSDSNVQLRVLPARRLWTHRSLAKEIDRHPPDVLFIPAHVLPFVLPASRLPASVVTVHDLGYHRFPDAHTHTQRLYLNISTRWAAFAASRLIAVSRATSADLRRFYGIRDDRIRVVHEGVHRFPTPSAVALAETTRRYGVGRPYGFYVGTLQPRKNLLRTIQAYASLHQRGAVEWDLVLAGAEGWGSQSLKAEVDRAGLGGRVHFPDYVPDSELSALFGGARFFCFPSLFEGFGLPILEAQSLGVAVLTSNSSSLPEVAGDAALLVDPTDVDAIAAAMLRLSQDEALRAELIAKGYENVKRFSWEKAAKETLAVLEEAASQSTGSTPSS